MSTTSKILTFESAGVTLDKLRTEGVRLAQCHGVFDLLYPAVIEYLEASKALADRLVVTIPGSAQTSHGRERPFFADELRAKALAALAWVDFVVVTPFPGAIESIELVRPQFYCLPKPFEFPGVSGRNQFKDEIRAVERLGGRVCFVGPTAFSSPRVIVQQLDDLDEPVREFCRQLTRSVSAEAMREAVDAFAQLKVLIIGDTIFDRYSYVKVQGLTSKNRIISGRSLSDETQCGGALAVFRHVKEFVPDVKFLSLVGTEPWVEPMLRPHLDPAQDLVLREDDFTTIIKQRFVEPLSKGKELGKLFSVNYLDAEPPAVRIQERLKERIAAEIKKVDLALVLDFGHGLFQPAIRELVQETAPFLALNCQTNSNNHGFNIISRQYQRADAFSLDEQELMLSSGRRHLDFPKELEALRGRLSSRYAWLTRGPVQTIGQLQGAAPCFCPPFENDIIDTIGAGDAFFSVAALAAARSLPIELATFLGQLAGAQAVKIVGNAQPICKQTLLETGMAMLSCCDVT